MAKAINLNADMGEGFGACDIGDDAGLLKVIRSASIACGFHAGDPVTMQRLVTQASPRGATMARIRGSTICGGSKAAHRHGPARARYTIAYRSGALRGDGLPPCRRQGDASEAARLAEQHGAENLELAPAIEGAIDRRLRHHLCRRSPAPR
jgi:hypothetical protein